MLVEVGRSGVGALRRATINLERPILTDRNGEANNALCSFLRSILGGPSVTCDIIRGEKVRCPFHRALSDLVDQTQPYFSPCLLQAPVKQVRITGVESVDVAYHRLLMAHKVIK